jgi:hypothetical protein
LFPASCIEYQKEKVVGTPTTNPLKFNISTLIVLLMLLVLVVVVVVLLCW